MNVLVRTLIVVGFLAFFLGPPTVTAHVSPQVPKLPFPYETEGASPHTHAAPAPRATKVAPTSDDATYRLYFHCVENQVQPTVPPDPPEAARCPYDVIDPMDIMGQPILLVDPKDAGYVAFNALHGGHGIFLPGREPPSNQSRDNLLHQTHTTFYNAQGNHGPQDWVDNPYYSPLRPPPNRNSIEDPLKMLGFAPLSEEQVFGTDNAATLDGQGRVYLASLYAFRNGTMKDYAYAIGYWKSGRVNRPVDYNSGNILVKFPEGVKLDSIHAVYVPASDRVVVLWREVNTTKSYINFASTVPSQGGIWTPARDSARMGPCQGITNPVVHGTKIYVGCFGDKGYTYANASGGQLHIHTIETGANRWTTSYHDTTTILSPPGQRPNGVLVDSLDGRLAALSAGLLPDGRPYLQMAKAADWDFARAWDNPYDFTSHLNRGLADQGKIVRPAGIEVVESRVNAATFVLRSGNIHMIYMERWKPPQGESQAGYIPEYYKAVISVQYGTGAWNAVVPLGVDAAQNTERQDDKANACQFFEARYQGVGKDVFNDLHDSIVSWNKPGTDREQREFIAFADCGNVRFAEVREEHYILPFFAAPPGTPPIPAPVAGANPAQVGAVAGALAGAMVLRMLAFKRKLAVEAPA